MNVSSELFAMLTTMVDDPFAMPPEAGFRAGVLRLRDLRDNPKSRKPDNPAQLTTL